MRLTSAALYLGAASLLIWVVPFLGRLLGRDDFTVVFIALILECAIFAQIAIFASRAKPPESVLTFVAIAVAGALAVASWFEDPGRQMRLAYERESGSIAALDDWRREHPAFDKDSEWLETEAAATRLERQAMELRFAHQGNFDDMSKVWLLRGVSVLIMLALVGDHLACIRDAPRRNL